MGRYRPPLAAVVPVIVVAVIALLYLLVGTKLGDRMSPEGWDDPHSESTRAAQIEQDAFGRDASGDVILLVTRDNPTPTSARRRYATDFTFGQLNAISSSHPDQVRQTLSYFGRPAGPVDHRRRLRRLRLGLPCRASRTRS